jgi:hypothetical protein
MRSAPPTMPQPVTNTQPKPLPGGTANAPLAGNVQPSIPSTPAIPSTPTLRP